MQLMVTLQFCFGQRASPISDLRIMQATSCKEIRVLGLANVVYRRVCLHVVIKHPLLHKAQSAGQVMFNRILRQARERVFRDTINSATVTI